MNERVGKQGMAGLTQIRKMLLESRNAAVLPCAILVSETSVLEGTWGLCRPAISQDVHATSMTEYQPLCKG